MRRAITLRQVEAFKAVIEGGTVSRAAEILNVSQPAVSKLIATFEADTGLALFDRAKGRLTASERGMRLYEEIDRVFAGIRQIETAVDALRREEQGLQLGVLPALGGAFMRDATAGFLRAHPNVHCSIHVRSSQWIASLLVSRKLDLGLVNAGAETASITTQSFLEHPLVCIMPVAHPLTAHAVIEPAQLDGLPFISYDVNSFTGQQIMLMFERQKIRPNIIVTANISSTLCELVAVGLGVSLVHPLCLAGMPDRIAVRRFEPSIAMSYQLCRPRESRNDALIEAFAEEARRAGLHLLHTVLTQA